MPVSNIIPSSKIAQPGVCTSTTRPASPYSGQVIYETDTGKTQVWNGSGWVMLTNSSAPPGLELIKTQVVGSNVTSVTVTNVFSSTYDKYSISWTGGIGTTNAYGLNMRLGSTTTGYYSSFQYIPWSGATSINQQNNTAEWAGVGIMTTSGAYVDAIIINPNLPQFSYYASNYIYGAVGGGGGGAYINGYLNDTTQYTDVTFVVGAGITGGTIRVYGYRKTI